MTADAAVATLLGLGRLKPAPGTIASAAALVLAWPLARLGIATFALAALAASVAGIWACDSYARRTGRDDPSECVVDELAGQWLACLLAPLTLAGFALAFLLFRAFDIVKPWPLSQLERLPGGYGIMADDLAAGLIAGLIVAGARRWGLI